jgi:hypothetical protein
VGCHPRRRAAAFGVNTTIAGNKIIDRMLLWTDPARSTPMANEFEKHIAMGPDKVARSEDESLIGQTKDRVSAPAHATRDTVRENSGTITTAALLVGAVGFAIGCICGQSAAQSDRSWH